MSRALRFILTLILILGPFAATPYAVADAKAVADKAAAIKKLTITCVKGKLTKKVTAVKPVCPSGYKKKA